MINVNLLNKCYKLYTKIILFFRVKNEDKFYEIYMGAGQLSYSHFTARVGARYFAHTCCVLAFGASSILSAHMCGNSGMRLRWQIQNFILIFRHKVERVGDS